MKKYLLYVFGMSSFTRQLMFLISCLFYVSIQADPILTISTNRVNLTMLPDSSATVPYTITNSSTETLTGLTLRPPALTRILSTTCGDTLAPGALCTAQLLVQSLGARVGQLVLGPLRVCAFGGALCAVADAVNNQVQPHVGGIPFVYALNGNNSTVAIANARDNILATPSSVAIGGFSNTIALSPNGLHVYVAVLGMNIIRVIDTRTNTISATINTAVVPGPLVVSPDNHRLYSVPGVDGTLRIFDTASNTEVQSLLFGSSGVNIAVTSDGGRVYAGAVASIRQYTVAATNQVTNIPLTLGTMDRSIAVSPDGARLYIAERGAAIVPRVVVLDTSNNTEITPRIPVGTTVGARLQSIVVSPDSRRVYVSNEGTNTVSVIDSTLPNSSNPIFTTPVLIGTGLRGLALSSDGRRLYACGANTGGIIVIDTTLMSATVNGIIAYIPVPGSNLFFLGIMS